MSQEQKMVLSLTAMASVQKAHNEAVGEFLVPKKILPNVVGMGIGVKWSNGQPTGEPALVVLVTHKVADETLRKAELVPRKLADMQTDVLSVGHLLAGGSQLPEAINQSLVKYSRPAKGGQSVGHVNITAGTIATVVYDILPGGSTNPSAHGTGIPTKYYILSNNHVLANSNNARPGDPIVHPGPHDGGIMPQAKIANLSRFVPIAVEPIVPREQHNNLVDAAIAECSFQDVNREIYWIGHLRGWSRKANVAVGTMVKKTGRTTSFTVGRITALNATLDINFGQGRVARFKDQIVTTNMSAAGDSGSLVTSMDNVAIGLLFAGSSAATILNQIENVRSLLRVEVADQIL